MAFNFSSFKVEYLRAHVILSRRFTTCLVSRASTVPQLAKDAENASKPLAVKQRRQLPQHPRLRGITLPPLKSNSSVGSDNHTIGDRSRRLRGVKRGKVVGTPIFLPNIVFQMIRNKTPPGHPYNPYEATFRVPLSVTKNDIKSYLLAVYGVESTYINTDIRRPVSHTAAWFKARRLPATKKAAYKRAVVGLAEPFYYPDSLEDMSAKDREFTLERQLYRASLDDEATRGTDSRTYKFVRKKTLKSLPDNNFSVSKLQRSKDGVMAKQWESWQSTAESDSSQPKAR